MRTAVGRIVVAAIAVLVLAGYQGTALSAAPGGTTIPLGAAISETGSLAGEGRLTVDGYNFAVTWINSHGGIKIHGVTYRFTPIKYYDDESSPAQDAALVDKLVTQNRITLILGPYSSDNTIAAAAVSSKDGAVLMADEGTSHKIWGPGIKNVVGPNMFSDQYMNPAIDALLAAGAKVKTAVIMHADDAFSVGVAKGAVAYCKAKGIAVLGNYQYPASTTDVASILAEIKPLRADVLLGAGHVQDAILITRQAKQANLYFKAMAFTVAPPTPDYVKALGKDAEDVIGPALWVPQEDFRDPIWGSTHKFVQAFVAQYHYEPDYHVAGAAQGVELFALAIQRAQSTDPAKVGAAFQNATYETIYGPMTFDARGHETNQHGTAIQIQEGKPVPVWPRQYIKNLRYPMPAWSQR